MPGTNDLGPFGPGVQETYDEPSDFGDSSGGAYSWFKDCSGPTADDGTRFTAQWANRMLKYIRRACDGMGIAKAENNMDRLLQAIQKAIRPAANIGLDAAGVGVFKETHAGTLTHMLRRLKGLGGVAVTLAESGDVINIDGSAITGAGLALFYPQVETSDFKLTVTIGSGKVTVDTGKTFIHRGCRRISTSDYLVGAREFNTSANKTYHLRWKWNNGSPAFYLYDLANAGYNVSSSVETHAKFDTDYDDMLIARVTTNGSNGITVTTLANRHTLRNVQNSIGTTDTGSTSNTSGRTATGSLNWARTPDILPSWSRWSTAPVGATDGGAQFTASDGHDHDMNVIIDAATRYGWELTIQRDYAWDLNMRVLSLA